MRYVERRPIVINAIKFTGTLDSALEEAGISMCQEDGICQECSKPLNKHGLADLHYLVCPSTYVIKDKNGIQLMSSDNFEAIYKPMYTDVIDVNFKEIS